MFTDLCRLWHSKRGHGWTGSSLWAEACTKIERSRRRGHLRDARPHSQVFGQFGGHYLPGIRQRAKDIHSTRETLDKVEAILFPKKRREKGGRLTSQSAIYFTLNTVQSIPSFFNKLFSEINYVLTLMRPVSHTDQLSINFLESILS